jgi:UDP-glucose 4-epimerase
MRIVVLGATGNVGSSVVDALVDDADAPDVVGVARRLPERSRADVHYAEADIATSDLVPLFRGADAVVHLAWLFQPSHQPMVTWNANALGSVRVFDAVAAARVPALVYASSVGAYSPGSGRVVDESWPTHSVPTASYGREKAYVERALDAFEARNPDIRVVRLRPAFIFKRSAATSQRRLFAGPFLPNALVRPGRLPIVPVPSGLQFQAVHTRDIADAYRRAVLGSARGAFNIAADPIIDASRLGEIIRARTVPVPRPLTRALVAGAWWLHLIPTEPALLDLFLDLPLLDTRRARTELGWTPQVSAVDALREALYGMADGAGGPTAPLAPDSAAMRAQEVMTGVGERDR